MECADPAGTVGAFLCRAGQHLRAAAIPQPRMEARMLLAHALNTDEAALLREPRQPVAPEAARDFAAMLERRLQGTPMAYLLGSAGFWTLDLETSPDTLIPRADTETLVEAALELPLDREAPLRILDLGTGTGALLLALLSELPRAFGIGVDLVEGAARLAGRNAARNGLAERAAFVTGSWDDALSGQFDLIVSNPPYIETDAIDGLMPEVSRHEPRTALDGGADGLVAYRLLAERLRDRLAPGGHAVLEIGSDQEVSVSGLFRGHGYEVLGCRRDLGGNPRALVLR
ncbi:peptide chain release factor N(5)-glutamine methyltransferase [Roseomonas elaeocarpi]|uniref:Release factor glutamine methyltransferase n=1 Tax=Roseomonas elaeocarpi TaxID=907779 RepID=A0ABV6JUR0_9PROT